MVAVYGFPPATVKFAASKGQQADHWREPLRPTFADGDHSSRSDLDAFFANAVTSVEDHRVPKEVADGRQFHTSWAMKTEIDSHGLAAANHFALRHGELIGFQMS